MKELDEQLRDLSAKLERAAEQSVDPERKKVLAEAASTAIEAINVGEEVQRVALNVGRLILRALAPERRGGWATTPPEVPVH
jgi:hypothetical protein